MHRFTRYLWVTTVSAILSALLLLPVFYLQGTALGFQLIEALPFLILAHWIVIGTVGWFSAWMMRVVGIFSDSPLILLGAILCALGWYTFSSLLQQSGELMVILWTFSGAVSGGFAAYLLHRYGFPTLVHEEQFREERFGRSSRYRAFLSYTRQDEGHAIRIWQQLDRYRTPREMVGRPGRFGPIPNKLYPVFRDREELTSGQNIRSLLTQALQNSDQLVILLSPNSAKSEWVNFEIDQFTSSKELSSVFPVILHGALDSKDNENNCIPPSLVDREILAADLRQMEKPDGTLIGDGYRLGMLKLIAGMLGADFEQLQRRESIREARRSAQAISIIAAVSSFAVLSGILFFIAANFFIWSQRFIDSNIVAEANRLQKIYDEQGQGGMKMALQFENADSGFCRAVVDDSGELLYGFFPDGAASTITKMRASTSFSIRYEDISEYGGSPFPMRIDGVARRISDNLTIIVALCEYRAPLLYGSFRSIFDPRSIDTIVYVGR